MARKVTYARGVVFKAPSANDGDGDTFIFIPADNETTTGTEFDQSLLGDVVIITSPESEDGILIRDRSLDAAGITIESDVGPIAIGSNDHGTTISGKLGFFSHTPASQPAKPTTLQNVIDALVALGLVASS